MEPIRRRQTPAPWGTRAMRNPRAGVRRYDPNSELLRTGLGNQEGAVSGDEIPAQAGNSGKFLKTNGVSLSWDSVGGSGSFTDKEVPTGSINGVNTAFVLAATPASGSEHVYKNGILQAGSGVDYTLSVATITFVVAPETGHKIVVSYRT